MNTFQYKAYVNRDLSRYITTILLHSDNIIFKIYENLAAFDNTTMGILRLPVIVLIQKVKELYLLK